MNSDYTKHFATKKRNLVFADDDPINDRAISVGDFEKLNKRFAFTVDSASSYENRKLPKHWTVKENGLKQSWHGERVYCNPPYSNIEPWVRKAWDETNAHIAVLLLPANRTDQLWWNELIEPFRDLPHGVLRVEFMPGRLQFVSPNQTTTGSRNRPRFGCCLCVFDWQAFWNKHIPYWTRTRTRAGRTNPNEIPEIIDPLRGY